MSVGGVGGANDGMAALMQILMQGMKSQTDMCEKMISVSLENSIIGEKMSIAEQIIDVYA